MTTTKTLLLAGFAALSMTAGAMAQQDASRPQENDWQAKHQTPVYQTPAAPASSYYHNRGFGADAYTMPGEQGGALVGGVGGQ